MITDLVNAYQADDYRAQRELGDSASGGALEEWGEYSPEEWAELRGEGYVSRVYCRGDPRRRADFAERIGRLLRISRGE